MTKPKKAPKAKSAANLKDLKAKKTVKGGFAAPVGTPIMQRPNPGFPGPNPNPGHLGS
jgi:hypothetical protein